MKKVGIIGDLINNAYGRARRAWTSKSLEGYQHLAQLQVEAGSDYLDVNIDNTSRVSVSKDEMLAFLPDLIPALQATTSTPLCFDNPSFDFHKIAMEAYDFSKSAPPIINSIAASRVQLEDFIGLIKQYDASVIVIASEKFDGNSSSACETAQEVYDTTRLFVERLRQEASRQNHQIFIDPGLPPVGADTQGLVNMGLDAIKLIRADKDLAGLHISVGLSNFAWGIPKALRAPMERAYLAVAGELGLDFSISNPDHNPTPLSLTDPLTIGLKEALKAGRPLVGETIADSGIRQASAILGLVTDDDEDDW